MLVFSFFSFFRYSRFCVEFEALQEYVAGAVQKVVDRVQPNGEPSDPQEVVAFSNEEKEK